jgi:hypothetical protein
MILRTQHALASATAFVRIYLPVPWLDEALSFPTFDALDVFKSFGSRLFYIE